MPAKRKSKTYFSEAGVSITTRRARFGENLVPIPQIDNVAVSNKASRNYSGGCWAIAGFCFIVAGSSYGASLKFALIALFIGFGAAVISFNLPGRKHTWTISVTTESGRRLQHQTTDPYRADRIIDALNRAILDCQEEAAQPSVTQDTSPAC